MWTKNQVRATAPERAHLARVKAMACICCTLMLQVQLTPTDVHHVNCNGEPRNHWLTIPLCWNCHQGTNGVEHRRVYLAILKISEWGLLAHTMARLYGGVV